MFRFLKNRFIEKLSRRELFRRSGLLALPGLLQGRLAAAAGGSEGLQAGQNIYQSIGVRPLINARGTFTIISGSLMLPEVRVAMDAAARQHVHLDELMAAIGARLAELTKAEWGMVSSGCAAALTHATAACVAGGNPDLHVRMPNLTGFPKDEVIIPKHSRNVYDAAVRAVGVHVVEVGTGEELEAAFGPRSAMVYILAGPEADKGPLSTRAVAQMANQKHVPVLVDAAAEILTVPNVHLENGATLVTYSGGKCIRGPQSAGLLLGRKDLVRAAWVHSAPHHGFARSMKVGKEEAIGMVVAVENWVKRDHAAEWNQWIARCEYIADAVSKIPGVTASVQREPDATLSNRSPRVTVMWESQKVGITGPALADILYTTEPRIALAGSRGPGQSRGADGGGVPAARIVRSGVPDSSISIVASMMAAGDEPIVAQRIQQVLLAKHTLAPAETLASPV